MGYPLDHFFRHFLYRHVIYWRRIKRYLQEVCAIKVKAVTYYAHDDIRVEERPVPQIGEDELLVRVHGCGLCGSDLLKIAQQAAPPVKLGHELTGTIVKRGRAVSAFLPGQNVIVAHHVPCGSCHYCRHGNPSMCATFKASNIDPCGLAEYIRVPALHVAHTTLLLPDVLSPQEASFTEPLACCVRAVRRTPLLNGDIVVIIGLGSIGLLMLQAVRALSEREQRSVRIYGVDLLEERRRLALALGADEAFLAPPEPQQFREMITARSEERGADVVLITVGGTHPFTQALAAVRRGGIVHIFAAHTAIVPLNIETLYQQELSLLSTYSSSPEDLHTALDLLVKRQVIVEPLISHCLSLAQFHEGVALMQQHRALKVYFQIAGESYGKYSL
ncbi:MAG: alcohol dehydrogenase catalytic domain-containing protein [Ktedonobacteraceae bacterium]|nr:alcohol dehydrogenase catalytic domain-containing protein [Ktedonobacteraceae bacterium]